jgi:hypothetical protein
MRLGYHGGGQRECLRIEKGRSVIWERGEKWVRVFVSLFFRIAVLLYTLAEKPQLLGACLVPENFWKTLL